MATAKKNAESTVVETAVKEETHDNTYSVNEFCRVGVISGRRYRKDLIIAAFKVAGVENATPKEAAVIVANFANKEVEN